MQKGNLSINSENIFPIIKKWLYSDTDIFLRELVSNGCDAIAKYKKKHAKAITITCLMSICANPDSIMKSNII